MQLVVGDVDRSRLEAFVQLFRSVFPRQRGVENCTHYLLGLISDLPRKNGERIAEVLTTTTLEKLQNFLVDCPWDPDSLDQKRLALMLGRAGSDPKRGVLCLARYRDPQERRAFRGRAVAVLRRVGQAGQLPGHRHRPLHRRPHSLARRPAALSARGWANDPVRRKKARVPAEIEFATKPELALALLDRAREARVKHAVVTADCRYGDIPDFLAGLEGRREPYIVQVSKVFGVRLPEEVAAAARNPVPLGRRPGRPRKDGTAPERPSARSGRPRKRPAGAGGAAPPGAGPDRLLTRLGVADGHRAGRAGGGQPAAGVPGPGPPRVRRRHRPGGLAARRAAAAGATGRSEVVLHLGAGPPPAGATTPVRPPPLVNRAAAHQDAKQDLGLGDYQGRMWPGLHRHLALVSLVWCYAVLGPASATSEVSEAFSPSAEPAGAAAPGASGVGSNGRLPGLPQSHRAADAGLPPPRPLTFRE